MAKGAESKKLLQAKILEVFEGAFVVEDGKEIRVPFEEEGSNIQIKLVLTTAKTNIENCSSPQVNKKTEQNKINPPTDMEIIELLEYIEGL